MLSPEEEAYILTKAYVPEHIVALIAGLSGGEPFLIDDYFCCAGGNWVVLIGYPLQRDFTTIGFERVLAKVREAFRPRVLSLIAPELPPTVAAYCRERESDDYYTLDTRGPVMRSPVKRNLRKAGRQLAVDRSTHMGTDHHELMDEFVKKVNPSDRVKNLFFKMPRYVESHDHAFVLNARDTRERLAAFYVVDLAALEFANYIIGCYSKKNYILGASDLLMAELVKISAEKGKRYIHLGLGVNNGIRRFKEKWGGKPTRKYEMCEWQLKRPSLLETILSFPRFGCLLF